MKTKINFISIILFALLAPILLLVNSSAHNTIQADELEISSREYPTANANGYLYFYEDTWDGTPEWLELSNLVRDQDITLSYIYYIDNNSDNPYEGYDKWFTTHDSDSLDYVNFYISDSKNG